VIATDVANLHSDANNITKQTALTETGRVVNGRGDHAEPARHPDRFQRRRHAGSRPDLRRLDPGRDGSQ
jgi:hypothetical protein